VRSAVIDIQEGLKQMKEVDNKKYAREKQPINPMEVERYKKDLKIGQQVKIKVQRNDLESRTRTIYKICTVVEKYKWLFLAKDQKGKRYAVSYIEMMIGEG